MKQTDIINCAKHRHASMTTNDSLGWEEAHELHLARFDLIHCPNTYNDFYIPLIVIP